MHMETRTVRYIDGETKRMNVYASGGIVTIEAFYIAEKANLFTSTDITLALTKEEAFALSDAILRCAYELPAQEGAPK